MILAAPPAAAMTYVNESRGLDPSVYGGGGSASSALLLLSPLVSAGSAALVSASALLGLVTAGSGSSWEGAGMNCGGGLGVGSVTEVLRLLEKPWVGK